MTVARLAALERLARLRAEQKLRTLATLKSHVEAARQRAEGSRAAMAQSFAAEAPLTVAEARMANAQAGRAARDLARADRELSQIEPRFRQFQAQAAVEFGRAEALAELHRRAIRARLPKP